MRVLIVEDDENTIALFESALTPNKGIHIQIARSKESAIGALKDPTFDLAVLDLKIPTEDFLLDGGEFKQLTNTGGGILLSVA